MARSLDFPMPSYPPATCASSATPIRGAGPTASRSWSRTATPISATSARRAFQSSTCAIPSNPKAVKLRGRTRPTPGACICRSTTICCSSSWRDMFHSRRWPTNATTTSRKADSTARPPPHDAGLVGGMAVFDISKPTAPRQIGFMPVEGAGLHRIWYVGGRWAYASALFDGFTDYILVTIDMAEPRIRRSPALLAAGYEARGRQKPTGRWSAVVAGCTMPSWTATPPTAAGATPVW